MTFAELKEKFLSVLSKQIDDYKELKKVIKSEEEQLNKKNAQALEQILNKEEAILKEIKEAEIEKQKIFQEIKKEFGFKPEADIKLKDVLLKMNKKDAEDIETKVLELIKIIKEIDEINSKSSHIIKNYLNYLEFFKKISGKAEKPVNVTYDPGGAKKFEQNQKTQKIDKII